MSTLELRELGVAIEGRHARVEAVKCVTFGVAQGEVVGLVGESGAGKTMIARAITALLPEGARTSGELLVDGEDVLRLRGAELERYRGAKAALCFQNPRAALSPARRAGDQVADRLRAHARADVTPLELFREVGIQRPSERLRAYPHELSGGMAQRVMISLAVACGPRVLVADEPTSGLDVTLTRTILALLRREAVDAGRALLIISHDISALVEVCDRICVMRAGELVEQAPTAALIARPTDPYTRTLLAAVPDVGDVGARHAPPAPIPESAAAAAPLLELRGLDVVYKARFGRGGHQALTDFDVELRRGETVGVVGESGSGKSTLAGAILGLVDATGGTMVFDGQPLVGLRPRQARQRRRRMQMVFQDPFDTLDPRRTVDQTLQEALALAGVPRPERAARIDAALRQVGIEPALRSRRRHELSGGQAQRVGIARALVADPELLVFDEPTAALDATVQAQILELIGGVLADRRRSAVYISHDLATVRSICDRVVVLYLGRVMEAGSIESVFTRPLHPYTRALLSSAPSLRGTRQTAPVELRDEPEQRDAGLGCPLAPRCPFVRDRCVQEAQQLVEREHGHAAACWRVEQIEGAPGINREEPIEVSSAVREPVPQRRR